MMDEASAPSADRGPVDFRALALLPINFETLIFTGLLYLLLELLDLQSHILADLRRVPLPVV